MRSPCPAEVERATMSKASSTPPRRSLRQHDVVGAMRYWVAARRRTIRSSKLRAETGFSEEYAL